MAWEGKWAELWTESCSAVLDAGQSTAKSAAELALADVRAIQDAFAANDQKGAARFVEERIQMAPEAKAARVLPRLFPRASKPLPTFDHDHIAALLREEDMRAFQTRLGSG